MIVLNGKLLEAGAVAVSPLGDGFMFGSGVFTTMRVRGGRVEFFAEHRERLETDARALGLNAALEPGVLEERCAACIAANRIANGGLKIVRFADAGGETSELIAPRPHAYATTDGEPAGFRLMTLECGSREARTLARHKTLNYLEHLQAKRAAVAAGFDEALWIDEHGRVLEGATSNVFAVIGGEIVTADVAAGLLPGIARRKVLELGRALPVKIAPLTRGMLVAAEEIFVTNALLGVRAVRSVDARELDLEVNLVTRRVAGAFERAAAESVK